MLHQKEDIALYRLKRTIRSMMEDVGLGHAWLDCHYHPLSKRVTVKMYVFHAHPVHIVVETIMDNVFPFDLLMSHKGWQEMIATLTKQCQDAKK